MKVKKVKWTEFNNAAYMVASENDKTVDPRDYEKTYEGEVIDTYKPIFGSPRFVVVLPDGKIREVKMTECRATQFDGKKQ